MDFSGPKKDFEKPPIKMHMGRLIGIYDVGTQPGFKEGDADKAQIIMEWELVGKDKDSTGKNFRINEFLGKSNHSKATLMARYQSMAGVTLKTDGKIDKFGGFRYDLPVDFSDRLFALVGQGFLVTLVAKDSGDPKVGSVSQPMEGMTIPEGESDFFTLDMEADDFLTQLESCPAWVKKIVAKSREWEGAAASSSKFSNPAGMSEKPKTGNTASDDYQDDPPF